MERSHLLYKAARLSYIRFGSGPNVAVCFHGYGEDATSFSFLERHAGNEFTFYAPDLPFHGETTWPDTKPFTHVDLENVVNEMLHQEHSIINEKTKLTLIGYSMGGRIALGLFQSKPAIVERLVLLAPDGLKVNFWYWLATQTWIGNSLFAFTMKHPQWFFGFLKLLDKLHMVNASIFKFVNYYIGDKDARRLLYARWTTLRKLRPDLRKIKSLAKGNKTIVRLAYGKHDRIILPVRGKKFCKDIEEFCVISVIPSGHQVLHEKNIHEILPALLH